MVFSYSAIEGEGEGEGKGSGDRLLVEKRRPTFLVRRTIAITSIAFFSALIYNVCRKGRNSLRRSRRYYPQYLVLRAVKTSVLFTAVAHLVNINIRFHLSKSLSS